MGNKFKVVCIDDEPDILECLVDAIDNERFDVVVFESSYEALDYIINNASSIAFIFSDFSMPKVDGLSLRESILEKAGDIPYSLVTGFYNKEMAVRGMELRINSFIEKPFVPSIIQETLDTSCNERLKILEEEREMIRSFVEESYPMLDQIEELILALESDPHDMNSINIYFRLLHTIKGTASCVGLISLPHYAHKYEDLVSSLKNKELILNTKIINVLLEGLDELKLMFNSIKDNEDFEFDVSEKIKVFDQDFSKEENQSVEKTVAKEKQEGEKPKKAKSEKIDVSIDLLDSFMELSGELTVLRNIVLKSATKIETKFSGDKDVDALHESLSEMHKVSSALQNEISEMRKISLDTVFRPLKRVVRDSGKSLGKKINFFQDGGSLRVDTSIGKVLSNTLVHLIRNGVDHGIENTDERVSLGKSEEGNVYLRAYEEGENIIVEIEDDGKGINADVLRTKAVEKGLYGEEEVNKMSDYRVYSMIFESGFSTAEKVTDISGRGVGMDMVRSTVEKMNGKILIDSKVGKGTKFVMILPIPRSVLIIKALMIECSKRYYCIALDDVAEVVNISSSSMRDRVESIEGTKILKHHGELIPLVDLKTSLKLEPLSDSDDLDIVIVSGDGFRYGICVDKIHDIEEVVVKKMSRQLRNNDGLSGVTLVGDGDLALILNLEGIAQMNNIVIESIENYGGERFSKSQENSANKEYMQFDLFSKKSFAISLSNVSRLEEFEPSSISFSGNIPLVRYREDSLPILNVEQLLLFSPTKVDEIIENREKLDVIVVNKKSGKFGLLVKKIGDIGVTSNEVHTNTIDRQGLLGTVFLSERTVTIVDVDYLVENYREIKREIYQDVVEFEDKLDVA